MHVLIDTKDEITNKVATGHQKKPIFFPKVILLIEQVDALKET